MVQKSERLVSLDIFRGLTIAAMILVNNPGSWSHVYAPLKHAEWFGLTPTDLIFPFFLFIVGVAIKLSLDKYLVGDAPRLLLWRRIVRRTLLLFGLGLLLNLLSNFNLATWRIPGVLQRIAVCYFFASLLYLAAARRNSDAQASWIPVALITAALLITYYLLMTFVPVPEYGAGQLNSPPGSLAAFIDRQVFGAHLWQYSKNWDPEGLLSTLPALATTLTGLLTGWWLKSGHQKQKIFYGLMISGLISVIAGLLFALLMPIGKNLWTPSFMLVTSGLALVIFGLIYFYADVKEKRRWSKPFLDFGANAIAAYVLSSIGAVLLWKITLNIGGQSTSIKGLFYDMILQPVFGFYLGSLVYALLYVALWWWVMAMFYKRNVFIKI